MNEKVQVHHDPSRNNQAQITKNISQVVNFDSSDDDDNSDDIKNADDDDEEDEEEEDNNRQGHNILTGKSNVKLPIFQQTEQGNFDTELRDIEDEDLDSVDGVKEKTTVLPAVIIAMAG